MFTKILVPTDGSELATAAALRVVPMARQAGARLVVVFVQDVYPYRGVGQVEPTGLQAYVSAGQAEGERAVGRIVEAAKAEGVVVETLVIQSDQVADGIVEAARSSGADLIAMGSHGRGGLARLMLGSVAAKVLVLSPLPVLIFK